MKRLPLVLVASLVLGWAAAMLSGSWSGGLPGDFTGWWLTPDQQAQRLVRKGRALQAAGLYGDPAHRGAAWFRGGDFERAAAEFGRLASADGAYNRGNALVMLGRYDAAIASYEQALFLRPGWREAAENRAIAVARMAKLAPPEDDAGGTGGMLEADEIVFDDSGRVERGGSRVTEQGGSEVSQAELQAAWLRRVQNDPADFLRARFAWQLRQAERDSNGGARGGVE